MGLVIINACSDDIFEKFAKIYLYGYDDFKCSTIPSLLPGDTRNIG